MMDRVTIRRVRRGALGIGRPAVTATCVLLAVLLTGWCWSQSAAAAQKGRRGRRAAAAQSKPATGESAKAADKASAGAKAKGKRSRQSRTGQADSPRLEAEYLRYLPDGCGTLGWIDVKELCQSSAVKRMNLDTSEFVEQWREIQAITGRRLGDIERIVFAGAGKAGGDEAPAVAVLQFSTPADPDRKQPSGDLDPSWYEEKVGRFTMFVKDDLDPWGVCTVDGDAMLIGHLEPLRAVLKRDGPIAVPEKLAAAYSLLEPTSEIAFAALVNEERMSLAALEATASLGIPAHLVRDIEAVTLDIGLDTDLDLRVAAVCRDDETANQLKGVATGLWALIIRSNIEGADEKTRAILGSVEFPVHGRMAAFQLTVPARYLDEIGDDQDRSVSSLVSKDNGFRVPFRVPGMWTKAESAGETEEAQESPFCEPGEFPTLTPVAPVQSAPSGYDPATSGYGATYSATISPPPSTPPAPRPLPTLKLDDVIRMAEAGVEEQVMLGFIQKHQLAAPLTADDLILLTEKKVGVNVILALQKLPAVSPKNKPAPTERKSDAAAEPDNKGARTAEEPAVANEPPSPGARGVY